MALVTIPIGGEEGLYTFYMTYDNADLRLRSLRGDLRNNSQFDVYAELVQGEGKTNAGRKHGTLFLKGTDTTLPIATTTAQRLVVTMVDGKADGIAKNIQPQARTL
jgi:hypothetical protein